MDNQSALQVMKNPEHHGRMKHLDLRFYWLRDTVAAGHIHPVCQIRPQGYGGGQGEPVPDSIGDSPISPDTPTRPILGTEEVIEVARGE